MTEERGGIFDSVKDGIVGAIRGVGEITDAVVDTVSGSLVNDGRATGAVGGALTSAIAATVRGAIDPRGGWRGAF